MHHYRRYPPKRFYVQVYQKPFSGVTPLPPYLLVYEKVERFATELRARRKAEEHSRYFDLVIVYERLIDGWREAYRIDRWARPSDIAEIA